MKKISIIEVGPRDGFQNLCSFISTDIKLEIIRKMADSGIRYIQAASFVNPKAVPQMADAKEVVEECLEKFPMVEFSALTPNLRGATDAFRAGLRHISYVVSLSASHNKANINRTHEESFHELLKIRKEFPDIDVCVDLATAFGCPFEGKKLPDEVISFLNPYIVKAGIAKVNLCDTIGVADPTHVRSMVRMMKEAYPNVQLQIHIHDTRNMGMVNTLAALECGADGAQSTLGGLGGCPFAPGASGNLATEDLVHMLNEMGYSTGIDDQKLVEAAKYELEKIPNGVYSGHLIKVG